MRLGTSLCDQKQITPSYRKTSEDHAVWYYCIALNFRGLNISQFCQILLKNKFSRIKFSLSSLSATHCICYELEISREKMFMAIL